MADTGRFIGGIRFGVSMDTKRLQKNIKNASSSIKRFVGTVKKSVGVITGFGAALGSIAFVKFTSDAFSAIDSLAKTSDKIGITTEALAGLRLAAEETGATTQVLDKSLVNLTKATSEAAQGVGLGVRAFEMLKIDAAELNKLSPDQQFLAIADAMKGVTNQQDQLTIATQLFGTRGSTLINTLRLGREELELTQQAAVDLGIAVSRDQARGVERAIDAWGRFKAAIGGIFRSIAVGIAPIIEGLAGRLTDFLKQGGRAKSIGSSIGKAIVEMAKFVSDAIQGMVAGGLTAFAELRKMILSFRNSTFAASIGLNHSDPRAAGRAVGEAEHMAREFSSAPKFSATIQKIADELAKGTKEKAEKKVEKARDKGGGLFAPLALASLGKQFVQGGGIQSLMKGFMSATKSGPSGINATPAQNLSFAESGSAESFRQRARIRRNSDAMKLDKKRNQDLKAIRDKLEKNPIVLAIAGLTG